VRAGSSVRRAYPRLSEVAFTRKTISGGVVSLKKFG
jgi:hypothetical protein